MEDLVLTCVDCGAEFLFSAAEQAYFAEHGFAHRPRRCHRCRHRLRHPGRTLDHICHRCGRNYRLDFVPPGRPALCPACLAADLGGKPTAKAE